MPAWAAVGLSVSFLLVFGEILPSAIITGPEQLRCIAVDGCREYIWLCVWLLSF